MSSRYVLGPSFGNFFEPTVPGTSDATIDNLRVNPGGKVTVRLVPDPQTNRPVSIYAFFLSPPTSVPDAPERTPEFFFNSQALRGSTDVRGVPGGDVEIAVPGVQPGSFSFVQVVAEYAE